MTPDEKACTGLAAADKYWADCAREAKRRHPSRLRPIPRDDWYDLVTGEGGNDAA